MQKSLLFLCASTALLTSATAQFALVAPPVCATAEGTANNVFPWGRTADQRYQQIFDSTTFTSQNVGMPILINQLRFRANGTTASWPGGTWPGPIDIKLSTSPVDFLGFSTTFASNQGADLTTVYSGPVTKLPGVGNGTTTPAPWFIDIALTTPFLYDPNAGDLTLDVFMNAAGYTGTVTTGADAESGANALCSRLWADGTATAVATGSAQNYGVVTEFGYVPAAGLYASFTSNVRSGPVPTTVNFSDTSYTSDPGGVLAWTWDLDGDNVVDSTLQNPSFTYTACGAYTVSLTVFDASNPFSTTTRNGYIEIGITPIAPTFTYASIAPGVFQFTDTSTPTPSSWAWDLDGDSLTDSTAQNPVWFYPNPCAAVPVTLSVSSTCAGPWSATQNLLLSPTSLTSVSIPNNGLSANNAGALFDVDVTNPNGVTICALSLYPFTAGATATCNVYVTDAPGGVATSYNQAALWRLVATGTGSSTGTTTTPSVFSLSNPVYLPQGQYAMAIGTSLGLRYTTIAGPVTTTGPDFSITTGRSAGPLFSAGIANRGFAGTFHYSVIGNGNLAGYGFFGSGCPGTLGISNLDNDSEPSLGNTMVVTANNLPQSAAIMLVGFSKTVSGLGALPLSLGAFGAPGCNLRVSPDANVLMLGTGNQATWTFTVPNNAAFVGLGLYNQAVVFDPAANAAGAVGSDAHAMLLGN